MSTFVSDIMATEIEKRPSDGDPTPAGEQSDGDPAATRVAMRLRDCLRKAWAPEGRAIRLMLVNKLKTPSARSAFFVIASRRPTGRATNAPL